MKRILLFLIFITANLLSVDSASMTEKDMAAYLMVYFKDSSHSLYMAVSKDGYSFVDINDGKPIIAGDSISMQKGIRDPHIFRGPDNCFYLSMTDLHIYAKKQGLRATEWERDGEVYGWGNNRGLVLMKSSNLINWTRANIQIEELFPDMKDVGCVWAPQTTYDEKEGKLMLYFTMRFKNEPCGVYYSYVNNDYNTLLTKPKLIFKYPTHHSYIDGDITKVGDKYHMFYAASDGTPGIKHAVSDRINEGYTYDPLWVDPEPRSCEAPNLWKRIGENKWVLMYDVYGVVPHNLGFCETSDFKTYNNLGRFNEGQMKAVNFLAAKHAAVIQITKKEYNQLEKKWHFSAYRKLNARKKVDLDYNRLRIADTFRKNLHWDIPLDTIGAYGSKISWTSSNTDYISNKGKLLKLSPLGSKKISVTMTATISAGNVMKRKNFNVNIAYCQPKYDGCLLTSLEGIREPYMLRGEDGKSFYLVATEMLAEHNDFDKRNLVIMMMTSNNFTNWNRASLNLADTYPTIFADAEYIKEPKVIFDPVENRYLVSFAVKFNHNPSIVYYSAYASRDFTCFETTPVPKKKNDEVLP